jgi:hypothetical protein
MVRETAPDPDSEHPATVNVTGPVRRGGVEHAIATSCRSLVIDDVLVVESIPF